jgi:hypothetical protein
VNRLPPSPTVTKPSVGQIGQAIEQDMHQASVHNGLPATLPGETPWLDGSTAPVQEGVYRRATLAGTTRFSLWANGRWHWNCATPALAAQRLDASLAQRMPWCGLLNPPVGGYACGPQPADPMAAADANPAQAQQVAAC